MKKITFLLFSLFCGIQVYSQCTDCKNGRNPNGSSLSSGNVHPGKIGNGNTTLGVIFDSTLCGLNYVQAIQNTQTRYTATPGTGFPTTDTVVGLPNFSACTHILKAYLYCEASCVNTPSSYTITDTVTNPMSTGSVFSTTLIGTSGAKCWSDIATGTWRADVTSIISGNGVYKINLGGFSNADYEVDGISLIVIYQDRSSTYTGSFILSDGEYTMAGGTEVYTATGFNACANSTYATSFMDLADLQNNAELTFNTVQNGTTGTFPALFFQSALVNTNVTLGQNSTKDSITVGGDCYALFLSGLYFQTACLTCVPSTTFSFTTLSTFSPCNNDSGTAKVIVSDTGVFTYHWSNGSTADSIFGVGAGNYTVTITAPGGCPKDSAVITVVPADSLAVSLTVTKNITCNGGNNGSISAVASGGKTPYTYSWNNGNTTTSISGLSAGTYTLITSDPNNCSVTSILNLRQPLALGKVANIVNPACYGDSNGSISLTMSGGTLPYTFLWSPTVSTTNSASGLKTGTYYITITDSNGCFVKDTISLTQPAKIVPIITGRDTVCTGEKDTLSVTGGSSYLWSSGLTTSTINFTAPNTHTFTVTASSGACSHDTTFTVYVLPPPVASISAFPDTICPADSALMVAGGVGRYSWSNGKTTDSIWVKSSTSVTFTLIVSVGTCADTAQRTIFIKPGGSTLLTVSKDTICPHDTTTLSAIGGITYKWSNGSTNSSIAVSPSTTTTYTLIANNACGADTLIKTIQVKPLPKPIISGRLSVCSNSGDTISISGGSYTYKWSNGSTSSSYILNGITGDSTISVEVFNGKCYLDTTIKIALRPYPAFYVNQGSICKGDCFTLKATDTAKGDTYLWTNGATTDTTTVCPDSTKTYKVTVSNGCIKTSNAIVTVSSATLFACCDTVINKGDSAYLSATSSTGKYNWSPSTGLNCDTCQNVIASPTVTTSYTVVSGKNGNGCSGMQVITIIVDIPCVDFIIPNVFTPNGDGRNDEFVITTENLDKYSIVIYDRWGKEMYKSSNPLVYWDGTTESGSKASDGVYFYIIGSTCQGKNYDKQGFVQLIR